MVGLFGWYKCGFSPIFPRLLLSFIPLSFHGHMEKPGCTPNILKKSPPILPTSGSSTIHRGEGHLKILCLSRQKGMVLRIFKDSRTKASSGEILHGAPVSIRGIWWLLGPLTLVLKRTVLRWWRDSLGSSSCCLSPQLGQKPKTGILRSQFPRTRSRK